MGRGTEHKSSGKMLRFLTLATVVLSASADKAMMKKIHHDMMAFNSMSACWGKGNMIMFKVGLKKAMESCMHENHSGLLKPANPILSLLNQQADTLPFPPSSNQQRTDASKACTKTLRDQFNLRRNGG